MTPSTQSHPRDPEEAPFVEGVGRFPVGHWHPNDDAPAFAWGLAKPGIELGPLPWCFEAFEGPILCFLNEVREPRYLYSRSNRDPISLPVVAMWASFSLLMNRFAFGPIIDVTHAMHWSRPLSLGEDTTLRGTIDRVYKKGDYHYIDWTTWCRAANGTEIFAFEHTIIDLRAPDGVEP